MKNFKIIAIVSIAVFSYLFLSWFAIKMNFTPAGIALAKLLLVTSYILIILKLNPLALKKAFFGRPRNLLLLLLLSPSLLLYSSGFDVSKIGSAVMEDYRESLFQFQRIFISAAIEEFLFRIIVFYGIICTLRSSRRNTLVALLLSSLIFGILHLNNVDTIGFWSAARQSYAAFALGYLFGVLYLKINNIWTIIIAHFIINYASHFSAVAAGLPDNMSSATPSVISTVFMLVIFSIPLVLGILVLKLHPDKNFYIYPGSSKDEVAKENLKTVGEEVA